jgi:subtilase family serine protease
LSAVAAFAVAATSHFKEESEMIFNRVVRTIGLACIGAVMLAIVPSATAGKKHKGVAPFLRLGPQEAASTTLSSPDGPRYLLRACQQGLSVGACYDPYQMRIAYGTDGLIGAGYDGKGQTIVIIDAFQSPNIVDQQNFFYTYYGLPSLNGLGGLPDANLGTFTQIAPDGLPPFVPGDPNQTGWANEIGLDVEWAHSIAPGANITLVLAKSDDDADVLSAIQYAVDHNLGGIISMSFGDNETCVGDTLISQYHDVFAAATLKGITLFASSGDDGAALQTCDLQTWEKAASHPATDPLVTAVGGTELLAAGWVGCPPNPDVTQCPPQDPQPGTYQSETVWNEGPPYGDFQDFFGSTIATGGGFSVLFEEPLYQKRTDGLHGGTQRAVPDVAYNAAVLHGVLTYLDIPGMAPGFYRSGGTSAGTPQWAAIAAIANQKAGGRLGFLNSAIYQIGRVENAYRASFHDITDGVNSAVKFDADGGPVNIVGFSGGPGWDATTGLGAPMAAGLVDHLIRHVSPGDGEAAISTTKKSFGEPPALGHKNPH